MAMSINELRTKRASLWEETKKFLAEHTDKDGKMAAADAEAYEKMEADIAEMGKTIDRLEKQAEMDKKLAMPTSKPLVGAPGKPEKKGTASDEYRKAMFTAIRTKFRDVSNVLQEGIDEAGGYLVPDEYDRRLIDVLDEENVLRGLATTIRTSGERKINIAATKPAALWVEEGGALTFGDATFDQKLLDAHKLHVAIKITEELLADNAFQLEDYIIAQFGKAIANAEEDAFLNGDGEGKPTGLFADAQVGVTIGTVEIEADDVIASYSNELASRGYKVRIVGIDKDLLQLINDNIEIYDPVKSKIVTTEDVKTKYGVIPSQMIDFQALVGDKADNILGVAGIGPVTAAKLIKNYGSLQGIYENINKVEPEKLKDRLITHREDAELSKKLATLSKSVKIFDIFPSIKFNYNHEKAHDFLASLAFGSLINRMYRTSIYAKSTATFLQHNSNILHANID